MERQAASRGGVVARHSKPESIRGAIVGVLVDGSASPPRLSFTLEGKSLGMVEAAVALDGPLIFAAFQLQYDDLAALHVLPCHGSLRKNQLRCTLSHFSAQLYM